MVKSWRVTWGERSWTLEDSTGRHEALVVIGVGQDTFDALDVLGPVRLRSWIAAFLTVADEREYVEVLAEVMAAPTSVVLDALTFE